LNEGRRKKEEGRRKKEEGRRKKEEGSGLINFGLKLNLGSKIQSKV
jgi:hypothetical protein